MATLLHRLAEGIEAGTLDVEPSLCAGKHGTDTECFDVTDTSDGSYVSAHYHVTIAEQG